MAEREVHGRLVRGVDIGPRTQCAHYHSDLDIIAIKFACCGAYYPCRECHDAVAGHDTDVWPVARFDENAVLCGACGHELTISEYLACGSKCPACGAGFNPGCAQHYELYFGGIEG